MREDPQPAPRALTKGRASDATLTPMATLMLAPMSDREYADFAQLQVAEYALQHVRAGEWPEAEARARSRRELKELLSGDLRPSGHGFWRGRVAGVAVGWVWVAPAPPFVPGDRAAVRWLAQITVEESQRGRGVGRQLLATLEELLAEAGVRELWLRVFDWNLPARRLYQAAGYAEVARFATDAHLCKRLTARPPR